ncbi:hypothetical protein D9757_007322 [Collybiopsis confluens]|uniref:Uncharacterized protein n=1 Tax=Collybiopsis confluens TaxID=2823264 RepID=A0A8H5HGA1_9AGAR|nr:hypothetical protein D9757_007322 [Collybiopsis confluens]
MNSEDITLLQEVGYIIFYDIVHMICALTMYGNVVFATMVALHLFLRDGIRGRPRKFLLVCVLVLFLVSTWSFVSSFGARVVRIKVGLIVPSTSSASDSLKARIDAANIASLPWNRMDAPSVTLILLIGDAIVSWRAWALWHANLPLSWLIVILMLTNTAVNVAEAVIDTRGMFSDGQNSTLTLDIASIYVSLVTNIVATGLIGLKAWLHHRTTKVAPNAVGRTVQRTFSLLVKAGSIFITIQAFYAILFVIDLQQDNASADMAYTIISPLFIIALILYPLAVIILVSLESSAAEDVHEAHEAVTSSLDGPTMNSRDGISSTNF